MNIDFDVVKPMQYINPDGFTDAQDVPPRFSRRLLFIKVPIVVVRPIPSAPIMVRMNNGMMLRMSGPFDSDGGTTPWITSFWIDRDTYKRPFYFHDFICTFGGIWVCTKYTFIGGKTDGFLRWEWMPMSRKQGDRFLEGLLRLEKASSSEREVIYRAVRIGAVVGIGGGKHKAPPML